VASDTDAARDRVIAARADVDEQLHLLRASARAAVDIPAKVRRSPVKAAAVAGGIGLVAARAPQRAFAAARRAVRGEQKSWPERLLPDEIETTLRRLGSDGDKVRGALERDFAEYAKRSHKDRQAVPRMLLLALARPMLSRGAKAAAEFLLSSKDEGMTTRLADFRERAQAQVAKRRGATATPPPEGDAEPPTGI
jgi:hypothetical protein